jgi:predicted permease
MSIMECFVWVKFLNTLPVSKRFSISVEGLLVNFEQSGLLYTSIVVSFIGLFQEERLEIDDNFITVSLVDDSKLEIDNPFFIKSA